jgi:ankyrin repeat protein
MSAFLGYKPIVELLLKIGANVNTLRGDGSSALLLASGQGYVSIVDILIKHGAYVNKARTEDGISPLFMAAQNGHRNNL